MTTPDGSAPPPGGGYPTNPPPPPPGPSSYPPPAGPPTYPAPGPSQPYPPAGPEAYAQSTMVKPRSRRTGLIALGVLALLVIVIVGALALFRDRISGDVGALKVGDCIDEPAATTSISEVQHQPCTEPHDGEVFALLTYPGANGAAYPGTGAFTDYVREQCLPAVETYTGRTIDEIDAAGLAAAYFYPTTSSWTDHNDRGVTCYIERDDGQKMLGTVKAAGAPSHSP